MGRRTNARLGFRSRGLAARYRARIAERKLAKRWRNVLTMGTDRRTKRRTKEKNRDDFVVVRGRDSESGARGETHYRRVPIPPTRCHVSRRCAHPPPISNRNVAKSNFRVRLCATERRTRTTERNGGTARFEDSINMKKISIDISTFSFFFFFSLSLSLNSFISNRNSVVYTYIYILLRKRVSRIVESGNCFRFDKI